MHVYMNCQQFFQISRKKLNGYDNIAKSFRGLLFKHPVDWRTVVMQGCGMYYTRWKGSGNCLGGRNARGDMSMGECRSLLENHMTANTSKTVSRIITC